MYWCRQSNQKPTRLERWRFERLKKVCQKFVFALPLFPLLYSFLVVADEHEAQESCGFFHVKQSAP